MKKLLLWIFLVAVAVGVGVAVWGVVSFKGNAVLQEKELYVSRHTDYAALLDSLKPNIKHHFAFDIYAERLNLKESFKKGHYVVKDGMNVIEIVRMLKLGLQTPVNVTMNNVKIPAQLAGKLAPQLEADSVELVKPTAKIKAGSVVSVRGKGKFVIQDLLGTTKKGRIIINAKKYI